MPFRWFQAFPHSVILELWKGISNSWEHFFHLSVHYHIFLPFYSTFLGTHIYILLVRYTASLCISKGFIKNHLYFPIMILPAAMLWDFKGSGVPLTVMHRMSLKTRVNRTQVNCKASLKIHWILISLLVAISFKKKKSPLKRRNLAVNNSIVLKSLPSYVTSLVQQRHKI